MNLEKEFAKVGLKCFKQYIYSVSYETFKTWPREEQEKALKDFFD